MKILCQACAAKYTIADEKVVGKVIKIKCKKCGAPIVVNGNDPSALAAATAPPDDDDGGATRVVNQAPDFAQAAAGAPAGNEWTVSVSDDDQRSMTTDQIVAGYRAGQIPGDAFVWRDGMTDWLPLSNVPELMSLVGGNGGAQAAPAPAAAPAYGQPAGYDAGGYGAAASGAGFASTQLGGAQAPMAAAVAAAQQQIAAAPAAAAAPMAARRAGGRGGSADLFGSGGGGAQAASQLPSAVGERNENSVLFSISALKATEDAVRGAEARPAPPRGGRPPAAEARIDDLFSLGPAPAAPVLAPPPMMAPYIEPPPPPPPPPPPTAMAVPAGPSMGPMSMGYPVGGSPYSAPQKKGAPMGLIIGAIVGVLLVGGGVAAFALTRGGSKTETAKANDTSSASTSTAASDDTAKQAAGTTSKPDSDAKPADTGSTTDTSSASDTSKPADSAKVAANGAPTSKSGSSTDPKKGDTTAKTDPTSKPDTAKTADPKPDTTPPPADTGKPDTGAAGTAEFDRGAAGAALSAKAGAASGCHKDGDPTGSASVTTTFAPSGHVAGVSVGAPFGGTPTGNCIAGIFHSASVPPFSGSPVSVPKHVSIH